MTQKVTRALLVICVSLQLLVIATSAAGAERVLVFLGGPLTLEQRLLLAKVNIALMAVGSVCMLVVGVWLAWVFVALRRRDDSAGEVVTPATARRATTFVIVTPRRAAAPRGVASTSGSQVLH